MRVTSSFFASLESGGQEASPDSLKWTWSESWRIQSALQSAFVKMFPSLRVKPEGWCKNHTEKPQESLWFCNTTGFQINTECVTSSAYVNHPSEFTNIAAYFIISHRRYQRGNLKQSGTETNIFPKVLPFSTKRVQLCASGCFSLKDQHIQNKSAAF